MVPALLIGYPFSTRFATGGGFMSARLPRLSSWLLVALLWLMPLQFSWATVARYCQHESVAQAERRHAGHHSHEHQSNTGAPGEAGGKPFVAVDADCHYCHASVAPFVISQYAQHAPSFAPEKQAQGGFVYFSGWIPPSIERPKWRRPGSAGMAGG